MEHGVQMSWKACPLDRDATEFVSVFDGLPCEQCVIKGARVCERNLVFDSMFHSHDAVYVLTDLLGQRFGVAGVQDDAPHVITEDLEEGHQGVGAYEMGPAVVREDDDFLFLGTVTGEVNDIRLVVEKRPSNILLASRRDHLESKAIAELGELEALADLAELVAEAQRSGFLWIRGKKEDGFF